MISYHKNCQQNGKRKNFHWISLKNAIQISNNFKNQQNQLIMALIKAVLVLIMLISIGLPSIISTNQFVPSHLVIYVGDQVYVTYKCTNYDIFVNNARAGLFRICNDDVNIYFAVFLFQSTFLPNIPNPLEIQIGYSLDSIQSSGPGYIYYSRDLPLSGNYFADIIPFQAGIDCNTPFVVTASLKLRGLDQIGQCIGKKDPLNPLDKPKKICFMDYLPSCVPDCASYPQQPGCVDCQINPSNPQCIAKCIDYQQFIASQLTNVNVPAMFTQINVTESNGMFHVQYQASGYILNLPQPYFAAGYVGPEQNYSIVLNDPLYFQHFIDNPNGVSSMSFSALATPTPTNVIIAVFKCLQYQ